MTPLRAARERIGKQQKDVCAELKIDPGHYCRMELGTGRPSPEVAAILAKYFGHAVTEMQLLYPERYTPTKRTARTRKPAEQSRQLQAAS